MLFFILFRLIRWNWVTVHGTLDGTRVSRDTVVEKHWYTVCVMDISACMGQSAAEQQQEGKTVGNWGSCRRRGVTGKQEQVTHAGVAASEERAAWGQGDTERSAKYCTVKAGNLSPAPGACAFLQPNSCCGFMWFSVACSRKEGIIWQRSWVAWKIWDQGSTTKLWRKVWEREAKTDCRAQQFNTGRAWGDLVDAAGRWFFFVIETGRYSTRNKDWHWSLLSMFSLDFQFSVQHRGVQHPATGWWRCCGYRCPSPPTSGVG